MAAASWPAAPPARTGSPSIVTAPKVRVRNAVREHEQEREPGRLRVRRFDGPAPEQLPARDPEHQRHQQRGHAEELGISSSARKAPMGPMKLRTGPLAPALKKGTGSAGL